MKISKILCATLMSCAFSSSAFANNAGQIDFYEKLINSLNEFLPSKRSSFADAKEIRNNDYIAGGGSSGRDNLSNFFKQVLKDIAASEFYRNLPTNGSSQEYTWIDNSTQKTTLKIIKGNSPQIEISTQEKATPSTPPKVSKIGLDYTGEKPLLINSTNAGLTTLKPSIVKNNHQSLKDYLNNEVQRMRNEDSQNQPSTGQGGGSSGSSGQDSGGSSSGSGSTPTGGQGGSGGASSGGGSSSGTATPPSSTPGSQSNANSDFVQSLKNDLNNFLSNQDAFDNLENHEKWSPIKNSNEKLGAMLKNTIEKLKGVQDPTLKSKIFNKPFKIGELDGKGLYLVALNDGRNIGFVNSDDPMATVNDVTATDYKTIIEVARNGNAENSYTPSSDVKVLQNLKRAFATDDAKNKLNEALDALIRELGGTPQNTPSQPSQPNTGSQGGSQPSTGNNNPSQPNTGNNQGNPTTPGTGNTSQPSQPSTGNQTQPNTGNTTNPTTPNTGNTTQPSNPNQPTTPSTGNTTQPTTPSVPANNLTKKEAEILTELKKGDGVREALANLTQDEIKKAVGTIEQSIKDQSRVLNRGLETDILRFSSNLATKTRLAKLSNPYNNDLALASAIKNLSQDKFAAKNDEALAMIVKEYTDRFKYDNNLWGLMIGAKGKASKVDTSLYGATLGFDRVYDNVIAGAFFTYANTKASSDLAKNRANNFLFGGYSRYYFDNHELDFKASIGMARNKATRDIKLLDKALSNSGKYNSTLAAVDFDYGYIFKIDESLFVKPTVGLGFAYSSNKSYKESGDQPITINGSDSKIFTAKAGLDIRKYISNGGFIYFNPGIEVELEKSVDNPIVRFAGSNKDVQISNEASDKSKGVFFTFQTGAELKITDALSTNLNFGLKFKSKESYYNGTIGLKYRF